MSKTIAILLVASALLAGFVFVLQSPSIEYSPDMAGPPVGIQSGGSPEQIVRDFLLETELLPPAGTPLQCCTRGLAWEEAIPTADLALTVREVVINSVELSTGKSLLGNLLDDDPTYSAHVHATIKTADDQLHQVSIELWEVGLLTPWSVRAMGDGWKPQGIHW